MVEVQVGEQHYVYICVAEAGRGQAVEQYVALFLDAEALLEVRREEGADAGLDQDVASAVLDQQGAAAEVDAVLGVWRHPALPEGAGGVAEHGPAVEFLAVAEQGGEGTHGRGSHPMASRQG
ncbi:hypothetical protein D3C71_1806320 [compost metagenome]